MAVYTQAPIIARQYMDGSGNPLASGKLFTLAAGGTFPADAITTYQTSSGTAHTNPIILDSAGRISGSSELFLQVGLVYKFILQTSAGVQVWVHDGIAAVPLSSSNADVIATAGEALSAGDVVYMARGTEGGTVAGNFYKADADAAITSSDALIVGMAPDAIASSGSGVIRLLGDVTVTGPLTPGAAYFVSTAAGALTSTEPSQSRYMGQAKSTTVITIAPNPSSSQLDYLQRQVFGTQ